MYELSKLTLRAVFEHSVREHADRTALGVVGGPSMTYAQLGDRVAEVQVLLEELGVSHGDRVALIGENMPNWGVVYLAVTTMGAVVVPIMQEFHQDAVHHILRHSGAKVAFVSERYLDKVDGHGAEQLHTVVLLNELTPLPTEFTESLDEAMRAGRREFGRIRAKAIKYFERKPHVIEEDDLAAILYTSGTTGHSKGVMLPHRAIVSNALGTARFTGLNPEDRLLSVLPLAHTYECTLGFVTPLLGGASVRYLEKPPTPRTLLPALAQVRPTFLLVVPLIIEKIYRNRIKPKLTGSALMRGVTRLPGAQAKLHGLAGKKLLEQFGGAIRCMCIGGAAISPEVERFLHDARFPYSVGYGMTETSPLVTGVMPADFRFGTTGRAMEGIRIKLDKPDPKTGEGEILVKGPNVMQGYYKAPKVTEETFTEDGWLRTGDLGRIDGDGFLTIKGRSKNVIIGASGENIYPEELEAIINQNPFVLESLVFESGGQLAARVHLDAERMEESYRISSMTATQERDKVRDMLEKVRQGLNRSVAAFQRVAKVIEQPEPFEKTPTQKIKRYLYAESPDAG